MWGWGHPDAVYLNRDKFATMEVTDTHASDSNGTSSNGPAIQMSASLKTNPPSTSQRFGSDRFRKGGVCVAPHSHIEGSKMAQPANYDDAGPAVGRSSFVAFLFTSVSE